MESGFSLGAPMKRGNGQALNSYKAYLRHIDAVTAIKPVTNTNIDQSRSDTIRERQRIIRE